MELGFVGCPALPEAVGGGSEIGGGGGGDAPSQRPAKVTARPSPITFSQLGGGVFYTQEEGLSTHGGDGRGGGGAITRLALECLWERFRFQKYPRTLSRNTWGKQCWRWPAHT